MCRLEGRIQTQALGCRAGQVGGWGQSQGSSLLLLTHLMSCPLIHRLEEVPLEVLRQRESKWLDMLNNWDKWMAKKHKKVRGLALGLGLAVNRLGGEGRE